MARCVKCGQEAADPVWAVYADPAFKNKHKIPFALHEDCFEESETITTHAWDRGETGLVETADSPRYRRVAPEED